MWFFEKALESSYIEKLRLIWKFKKYFDKKSFRILKKLH